MKKSVNSLGCYPVESQEFTLRSSTNIQESASLKDFIIEDPDTGNKIIFRDSIMNLEGVNLDNLVDIKKYFIEIDTSINKNLNEPARLVFNYIDFKNPEIRRDSEKCKGCKIISYKNKKLEVFVPGFSRYSVIESLEEISDNESESFNPSEGHNLNINLTGFECDENWLCSPWSECINGTSKRSCIDLNTCDTVYFKPIEEKECEDFISESNTTSKDSNPKLIKSNKTSIKDFLNKNLDIIFIVFIIFLVLMILLVIFKLRFFFNRLFYRIRFLVNHFKNKSKNVSEQEGNFGSSDFNFF